MKNLDKAFDKIPDNQDLVYQIGPDGQVNYSIENRATGQTTRKGVMTPDMLKTVAYSLQTGVGFDQQMADATRTVAAWHGRTGVDKPPNEAALKRQDNAEVNRIYGVGVQAGHSGDLKGLKDAESAIFERMGQTEAAVATARRMYEDAGVEPPPALAAYGPKRTGEEGGGTLTERDRKAMEAKKKQFRTQITEAEKANDGGKALGEAHTAYADAMFQAQKEDQSIDKNEVVNNLPTSMDVNSPEYATLTNGAYQILRKNPVAAGYAVQFMKAITTPGSDYRFTEDGRVQAKGLSQPLFISRDLLADIEAWRQANKKAP